MAESEGWTCERRVVAVGLSFPDRYSVHHAMYAAVAQRLHPRIQHRFFTRTFPGILEPENDGGFMLWDP